MTKIKRHRGWGHLVTVPVAWAIVAANVLMIVWIVLSSLKSTREMALHPWSWPKHFIWSNYRTAWVSAQFGAGVGNSLLLIVGSGLACILLAAPAAYALSRFRVRSSGVHTALFVLGLGIPAQTMFIPLYVAFDRVGLVDSVWGLMLIYTGAGIPYALFLLTAFFRSLPVELEEAAALDGAGPGYTFWRIMLPLARSGLITIFVLQAIGHWGETFFALVMLHTKTTLSLSLYNFTQTMQYTGSRYSVLFAGLVILIAPLLVLYIVLGRRIIEGISAGYSK
ncbi:carbohydrate ABC transporter permease [Catenulispora sp. NF23]|uniref:Carbohydrate ABC transporter permease n=1 Tax=Catenulispora pinistramenti TaxID=2705254 RepID=A0ABS5KPK8_9ACTN|nr:carbohydrate ABC transporter permease [Catenulispora pinistramenti]MBS2535215.1 carbohydrate ABC transporter permease [Catenulispora pinistramenti]MBS2547993.1 carbohydrate ABC transporter permease [Catenulispora pinistramenti]